MPAIVERRYPDWQAFFSAEQLNRLAENSGGDLRDFFRMLRLVIARAPGQQQLPVPDAFLVDAEDAVRNDMLPIAEDDLKWLGKIMARHKPELPNRDALPDFARLQQSKYVLQYQNGEDWYDVRLPLVIVLPQACRGRLPIEAPDLWAVRTFTATLPVPIAGHEPIAAKPSPPSQDNGTTPPSAPEQEWHRLWTTTPDRPKINPWDGFEAVDAALDRGDLLGAQTIARQAYDLARLLPQSLGDTPQSLRDLSVSLDNIEGQVNP
ncbi:hypothetical protein DSCO28_31240 [Desulfosarcina ovata subsp. sediminis]|uniref:Uncharacterized protein n=1 Tax=Desulfosarcina ovata subsp. sediminis TaxID=885957 RepID=A0A5K7ZK10_9BACT|nr:hypothetical protein [Desulfosarcina ovata]BBO82558.1 hypothetical protein DSCO28_31240 [Desulfosarcina ovata subsp. sediminis]